MFQEHENRPRVPKIVYSILGYTNEMISFICKNKVVLYHL